MTTELDTTELENSDFFETLTMAELAVIETETGIDLANQETGYAFRDLLGALVLIAARRLGHTLTRDDIDALTLEQAHMVLERAAHLAPTTTDAAAALMATIAGKDQGRA